MIVTDCTAIAEDLSLHAAGEAVPRIEAHLATCPACRQRHAELQALCGALFALREAEPVVHFDFRRAAWPLAIAASVLFALWPSSPPRAPLSPPTAPPPPTWFAYQRAAADGEAALDRLLQSHASVFDGPLPTTPGNLLTSLAFEP